MFHFQFNSLQEYNIAIIKGSHKNDGEGYDDDKEEQVFDYDVEDIENVVVKPGEMIIFHQKLIHAGGDSLNPNGEIDNLLPGFDEEISHLYLHSYFMVQDRICNQGVPQKDTTYYVRLKYEDEED